MLKFLGRDGKVVWKAIIINLFSFPIVLVVGVDNEASQNSEDEPMIIA